MTPDPTSLTWRAAFAAAPGPRTFRQGSLLWLKGVCMGAADIVPGVSGGTIALITGIYEDLLRAVKSIDAACLKNLLRLDIKKALAGVHIRFLMYLLFGIAVAIVSLARLMNYLLHVHPVQTWSLFFGLIVASILVIGRQVSGWAGMAGGAFISGAVMAFILVGLMPVATPQNLGFIFLCGMVAICAMILPGISGAYILLILGKYEFITGTLKNPFIPTNLVVIMVFCTGCLVGLMGFSRFLSWLLARYHNLTLAFLTGLMAGSMRKIWPWKEVVEVKIIRGAEHIIWGGGKLPDTYDSGFALALCLMALGFAMVMILERVAGTGSRGH